MDASELAHRVDAAWEADVLPALQDYIRIPNLSPMFDPDWAAAGHMAAAVELVRRWAEGRRLDSATVEVVTLPERTPVLLVEVPGTAPGNVLLYGHLDKQPPMAGWRDGLAPFEPVIEGDLLYGRGGADDGYAAFAALTALEALQATGAPHPRCTVLIEASEESGSPDLPAYVELLAERIGAPDLVVCLDSGCATYDRLWLTTSLRGLVGLTVTVTVLDEGAHSGSAGGVVPSSFRLLRRLLDRVEDATTGHLLLPELWAEVPPGREQELTATAAQLGDEAGGAFALRAEALHAGDPAAQLRARTWEPAMEVVGAEGLPPVVTAGNVLRPSTTVKLSFRLPPTADADAAAAALATVLGADPPEGAHVEVHVGDVGAGWDAPALPAHLAAAVEDASLAAFGEPPRSMGEGGSIPFMAMLGERFPAARFVVTGVLGPGANAHGPNEHLHLPMARRLTTALAHLLADPRLWEG